MTKKRRKATADEWMGDVRKWAKRHPQIVRMRIDAVPIGIARPDWYRWSAQFAGRWIRPEESTATEGGCKCSGNAWLRRLGKQFGVKLTPRWE